MPELKITAIGRDAIIRWNELLKECEFSTFRNSFEYQYAKNEGYRQIESFIFSKKGKDVAGVHYNLNSGLWGFVKSADILSGLILKDPNDYDVINFIVKHFSFWGEQKKASFCRVYPWLPTQIGSEVPEYAVLFNRIMQKNGYFQLHDGRDTYQIDLSLSDQKLLSNMNAGTRRKIKKGITLGFDKKFVTQADDSVIHIFWQLYSKLGQKKDFNTLTEKQFKLEVSTLLTAGQAAIQIIRHNDQIINMSLVTFIGMGMYFHGAVNHSAAIQENFPSSGHLAQWGMIQYLKSKGLKKYDMAFCPGPIPQKDHPLFDMWRFKHGFGGEYVKFVPTYGKVLKPIRGRLYKLFRYKKL